MADIRAEVANALHWDLAIPRRRVTARGEWRLGHAASGRRPGLPEVICGGDRPPRTRRDREA